MARLISIANGNFTSSTSWAKVDDTSFLDSEATYAYIGTSTSRSSTFTPGAITIDGIAIKLYTVAASSGTITVQLYNATDATEVTNVQINRADLWTGANESYTQGWVFFKFSSPQTLIAGKSYSVGITCSASNAIRVHCSTGTNWSRMLRTTTTQAPASGDQLHIMGEFTGPGASTPFAIVMDNTATTSFGPTVSGGPPQGITISRGGTLSFGVAVSTNYYLKWKGIFSIFYGGTLNVGTEASPIPSSSTAVLEMNCVAAGDSGLRPDNGGTVNIWGATKSNYKTLLTTSVGGYCTTNGTSVVAISGQSQSFVGLTGTININGTNYTISSVADSTHLTLTGSAGTNALPVKWIHAGSATVIQVADTTGWSANDELVIVSTSRTYTETEKVVIQSVDSSTQVTLTTALVNRHIGEAPTQASVANITRNVFIRGVAANLAGYSYVSPSAQVVLRYASFYWMGTTTAQKRGVEVAVSNTAYFLDGLFDVQYCVFRDGIQSTTYSGIHLITTTGEATIQYNIFYNLINTNYGYGVFVTATSAVHTIQNNIAIGCRVGYYLNDMGSTITNNISSANNHGFWLYERTPSINFSGNIAHSNSIGGFSIAGASFNDTELVDCYSWRNGFGLYTTDWGQLEYRFNQLTCLGNVNSIGCIAGAPIVDFEFRNSVFAQDIAFPVGYNINATGGISATFTNCSFSVASGIYTGGSADIYAIANSFCKLTFDNCLLQNASFITGQANLTNTSFVKVQKFNRQPKSYYTYLKNGTISLDETIFHSGSSSQRLTPISTGYLESDIMVFAVQSGQQTVPSIYIRTSSTADGQSYNGQMPRLFLMKNQSLGITEDVLLASGSVAASGAWEKLSGLTPATNDDGILSFYVDCGGGGYSQGWVNIASFDTNTTNDSRQFQYYKNGSAVVFGNNTSGSVTSGTSQEISYTYFV